MIGGEGRIRAANGAFLLRAAWRIDANITGRDFAAHMRVDAKGRLFLAREESGGVPLRLLQVPLKPSAQPAGAPSGSQAGPIARTSVVLGKMGAFRLGLGCRRLLEKPLQSIF